MRVCVGGRGMVAWGSILVHVTFGTCRILNNRSIVVDKHHRHVLCRRLLAFFLLRFLAELLGPWRRAVIRVVSFVLPI